MSESGPGTGKSPSVSQVKQGSVGQSPANLPGHPGDEAVDSSVESSSLDEGPLNEDSPIEPTTLGNAIDDVMARWCQLFSNVCTESPISPPSTIDHVKEVAEICQKHFRNATLDVAAEFNRIAMQWELEHPKEAFDDELQDLELAITRQQTIMAHAKEVMEQLTNTYFTKFPHAGKQHLT